MKIMKQRAAQNFKNATKANAAESRWEKFRGSRPPPPPVPDQLIDVKLRGADWARRVVQLDGCRSAICSSRSPTRCTSANASGSSGPTAPARATCSARWPAPSSPTTARSRSVPAPRSASSPRSTTAPTSWDGNAVDIVRDRAQDDEKAMKSLARYGLASTRPPGVRHSLRRAEGPPRDPVSRARGPQRAAARRADRQPRHRVVRGLGDSALDGFVGTVIAVSHDRTFLARFDRFVMIGDDGEVYALPDYTQALAALAAPNALASVPLANKLS